MSVFIYRIIVTSDSFCKNHLIQSLMVLKCSLTTPVSAVATAKSGSPPPSVVDSNGTLPTSSIFWREMQVIAIVFQRFILTKANGSFSKNGLFSPTSTYMTEN